MSDQSQRIGGMHAVRTALRHGRDQVQGLFVARGRHDNRMRELLSLAREQGIKPQMLDRDELDRLLPGVRHQGVVAEVAVPVAHDEGWLRERLAAKSGPAFLLVLDGVQDPHNLGACLRSADAAAVDAVIAPRDRAAGLTPVACKVASGAADSLPFVQVTNLARTLRALRDDFGIWVVGTAGEADTSLYGADLRGPLALVMGGEEKGLRRLTREQCDQLVHLPMAGSVESLNVSVASGICLFEAVRQRFASEPKNQ